MSRFAAHCEYDESDSDDAVVFPKSESRSSSPSEGEDDVDFEGEADRLGLNGEGDDFGLAYHLLFCDEDSPFRKIFPEEYEEDDLAALPILTDVLPLVEASTTPEEVPVVIEHPAPPPLIHAEETEGGRVIKTTESPVTLFMAKHGAVIFPVEKDVNRKRLQEMFAADPALRGVDPDALNVGYINSEPVGLGAACVADPQLRSVLLATLHGSRLSTAEDLRPFYKEKRVKSSETNINVLKQQQQQQQRAPKPKSVPLIHRMADAKLLADVIEAAGGLQRCHFFAMDVEAAVVLKQSVPLPLEVALVPCGSVHGDFRFHWFTHPGYVEDEYTANRISSCCSGVGHAIPYKHAAFLRKDYPDMAWELNDILSVPGTILINKGSAMDLHALQFVYAVAERFKGDGKVPQVPQLNVFDISAIEALFPPETAACEEKSENEVAAEREALATLHLDTECWFHHRMSDAVIEALQLAPGRRPHCARADASELAARVKKCLLRAGKH